MIERGLAPIFLAISAGEGEGGWSPAPQPRIVGGGATPGAGEVFRIFERSFQGINLVRVIGGCNNSAPIRSLLINIASRCILQDTKAPDLKNDLKKAVDASSGGSSGSHCSGHATAR